ncbi:Y-family DNA polymerase [Candidatus Kaiserbacteria bacterium]|nr:MAG: Y-family DNA polymerase [Candidatus Kaiserbacteria bacterium]
MFGLMDCNNFFVSCERLFRPDLVGKPVAVLSSNDGCIVARSQEVKDMGISMGVPVFQIKEQCKKEKITLFSSNFNLYRDISARVMSALRAECGAIEMYSIDEAFFEVPGAITEKKIGEIRTRIIQKTGIPVSIGVAETKTLAKVANSIAKKRMNGRLTMSTIHRPIINNIHGRHRKSTIEEGVCVMDDSLWKECAASLSCGSVWGIGRQTSAFLTKAGINTVAELLAQDRAFIKSSFGVVGERLVLELNGIAVSKLGDHAGGVQQSIASTRSFGKIVTDKLILQSALGHHVAHVTEKLRTQELVASTITVVAQGSRFGEFSHREGIITTTLLVPTDDTFVLTKEAMRLLDRLFDPEIPYKKAGIILGGIEPKHFAPISLFPEEKRNTKTSTLSVLSDSLNKRFGRDTIRPGITLGREKWQEHKEKLSPQYTTRWTDIARVKAI